MAPRTQSRRDILRALGLGIGFVPLLRGGRAEAAALPPNVIFITWPNGCDGFWPTGTAESFEISTDEDSPIAPLAPWKDRLQFIGGLDNSVFLDVGMGGGHAAMPFIFTGVHGVPFDGTISDGVPLHAGGPSLDYYLAAKIAEAEGNGVIAAQRILVQRAMRSQGDDVYLSFAGPVVGGQPNVVAPYDDPVELWDKLYALSGQTEAERARIRKEKKSILDVVGRRLEATCGRLSADDRQRCEKHLESLREQEKLLDVISNCSAPLEPDANKDYLQTQANPLVPEIQQLQMGMLVSAMACGVTRTASLLWCNSHNNGYHFSWLADKDPAFGGGSVDPEETGGGPSEFLQHHEIAHNEHRSDAHKRRKKLADQWFLQNVADLMQRLYDVKEGGSTLLDRTLIVVSNLQRTGGGHQVDDLPFLLAGNCNGYFQTARFHRWASGVEDQHLPINRVLTEVCNAMGFPHDSFGDYGGSLPILRA